MSAATKTVMALALVLTGCAALEAPVVVEAEPVEDGMTFSFKDGEFGFNGQTIAFPAQMEDLVSLLGPPSRSTDKGNILHTWDELGILAYEGKTPGQVRSLTVRYAEWKYDHDPRSPFSGRIVLPGGTVTVNSTPKDLRGMGFWDHDVLMRGEDFRTRDGDLTATVSVGEGVESVSLAWSEYPRERSKPVPSPDAPEPPLFETSQPFRYGTVWFRELRREGRVSVATVGKDVRGGASGAVMFVMYSLFEMTVQRPFPYFVVLKVEIIDGEPELVIGYVDTDQPDVEALFPDYFDESRTYKALSTDPKLGLVQLRDHPYAMP